MVSTLPSVCLCSTSNVKLGMLGTCEFISSNAFCRQGAPMQSASSLSTSNACKSAVSELGAGRTVVIRRWPPISMPGNASHSNSGHLWSILWSRSGLGSGGSLWDFGDMSKLKRSLDTYPWVFALTLSPAAMLCLLEETRIFWILKYYRKPGGSFNACRRLSNTAWQYL